jgi:hypothetical protein
VRPTAGEQRPTDVVKQYAFCLHLARFGREHTGDHCHVIRPGYFGQGTSVASTAQAFRERVARGVQRLPQGGQLGPVASPTHQAAISMYGVVGFTPLHWLSWFLTDPTGRVSLGCHGLSPEGKKGRLGRDVGDLCEQAIGGSSRCMGRSTRIQRDPRTGINRFVQRDSVSACRSTGTKTCTRTLSVHAVRAGAF